MPTVLETNINGNTKILHISNWWCKSRDWRLAPLPGAVIPCHPNQALETIDDFGRAQRLGIP